MTDGQTGGIVRCPDPNCGVELGDPSNISTFIDAGNHADDDHGNEVIWFHGEDGWKLRYQPTDI